MLKAADAHAHLSELEDLGAVIHRATHAGVFAYIDYNQKRIHSSLGYMTPYEFLARVKVTQHDG